MGRRAIISLLCGIFHLFILSGPIRAESSSPGMRAGQAHRNLMVLAQAKPSPSNGSYYEPTIKNIITADCGRCHSGPVRNLMDYDNLKTYADTGMLETMIQGPMRRFAGNDVRTVIDWVRQGAPEKPEAKAAAFTPGPGSNSPVCPRTGTGQGAPLHQGPNARITYGNTIKHVLAKDCLRCHSGPFRNLCTYKNVKMYVDNGLLKTLVLPGGPMHRFAGPDTRQIMAWINSGAPP